MALISQVPMADVAAAAARALEASLGDEVALRTGNVAVGDPAAGILPDGAARTVVLPFRDGITGDVALVVDERLATALEAATPDESLTTAALPALVAAVAAIAGTMNVGIDPEDAREISTQTLLSDAGGDSATVAFLGNDAHVACLVVRVVDEAAEAFVFDGFAGRELVPAGIMDSTGPVARPLALLNDVAMDVTAELGRRRLKMRDIVTLQPGSVLQLDRAAGSPVDVLVNGALVWRGEVVVVDDDLGVRVSEVVVEEPPSMPGAR